MSFHDHAKGTPTTTRQGGLALIAKRCFDLVVAFLLIVIFTPVMAVVALGLLASGVRPITFSQERVGRNNRIFRIHKFRSMTDARDEQGHLLPDADRLTTVGRLLRNTSLDELPQLWNVFRGDVSLVGPRPLLVKYLPLYSPEQARRHDVLPGITGWAQVNGRNAITWDRRFELDIWYVEHWSFWLDLKILVMTALKVVQRSDVSAHGHATMPEFTGSAKETPPCV